MDSKSANKLAVTALNSELYAAFGKAWIDAKGNLAATALSIQTSYEQAGARAYLFNIVPADDPRLSKTVAAYGAFMKDPTFQNTGHTQEPPTSGKTPTWDDIISDARDIFSSLKNEGKMNKQYLGQSFYQASGISQVLDRDGIRDAHPFIRTRLMKEIAPGLENIALVAARHGDGQTSDRLLALTAAAVTCGNDRQLDRAPLHTPVRQAHIER